LRVNALAPGSHLGAGRALPDLANERGLLNLRPTIPLLTLLVPENQKGGHPAAPSENRDLGPDYLFFARNISTTRS